MLLAYFGEGNLHRCGTCDYCRERNKLELNDLEMEELRNEIHTILKLGPELPVTLAEKIKGFKNDKVIAVLRWLIDNGEIGKDALGRIFFKED